jgi:hypothetical protein
MIEIMKNLANLIKVKTIVTMVMILVYAVLAMRGTIGPDHVMSLTGMVIAFYFGTQHEQRKKPAAVNPDASQEAE